MDVNVGGGGGGGSVDGDGGFYILDEMRDGKKIRKK